MSANASDNGRPPSKLVDSSRLPRERRLWIATLATLAEVPGEREWNLLSMADARVREGYQSLAVMHTLSSWMRVLNVGEEACDPLISDLAPTAGVELWAPVTEMRQDEFEVTDSWVRQTYFPTSCLVPRLRKSVPSQRVLRLAEDDPAWQRSWGIISKNASPGARYAVSLRYLGRAVVAPPEPPRGTTDEIETELARLSRECLYFSRSVEVAAARSKANGRGPRAASDPASRTPTRETHREETPLQTSLDHGMTKEPPRDPGMTKQEDDLMSRASNPLSRLTPSEVDRATKLALKRMASRKGKRPPRPS